MLGKLTGNRSVAGLPGVGQELRRAAEYVKSYDYRQDEGRSATGAPTFTTTLVVRFEPEEVDGIAATLGLPVWAEPRPKPVLWLAIDDGRGPRLVALAQTNAARAVLDRAQERGYRLGLPSGSAAEQAAVGAIWRGDAAAIARLSSRYSPPMQLIGKLYRAQGRRLDRGLDLRRQRQGAVALDRDPARRAPRDGHRRRRRRRCAVEEVRQAQHRRRHAGPLHGADRRRAQQRGLPAPDVATCRAVTVVRGMAPVRANADGIVLELDLITGLPGLKRMVGNGDVLDRRGRRPPRAAPALMD